MSYGLPPPARKVRVNFDTRTIQDGVKRRRLRPSSCKLLWAMMCHPWVDNAEAYLALYGEEDPDTGKIIGPADGGPLYAYKIIDVQVCHLRKVLEQFGWTIVTKYGFGRKLETLEDGEKIRAQAKTRSAAENCRS